jgi:peptidoglycan/LPS O-acetylase OafA/YrhL
LDGIRALAVMLVIGGHGAEAWAHGQPLPLWMIPLTNSSFGVRLFFVLSGFLITKLLLNEYQQHGTIQLSSFYVRRSLRIFPAFYLYLAVILILRFFGWVETSPQQLIAAATFSWNYLGTWHQNGPAEGWWFLGHLWTLALEEQFYLVWPGLFLLLKPQRLLNVALILVFTVPVVRLAWYYGFPAHRGLLGMMFHTAIDSILVGSFFALAGHRIPQRVKQSALILYGALLFTFLVSPFLGHFIRPYRITIGFGLDAVGAGILILHACRGGKWQEGLSWGPLPLIGLWSYSIYLWQQLFLTSYNTHWSGQWPWNLVCILGCALGSFYLVEQPVLRYKKKYERARLSQSQS